MPYHVESKLIRPWTMRQRTGAVSGMQHEQVVSGKRHGVMVSGTSEVELG